MARPLPFVKLGQRLGDRGLSKKKYADALARGCDARHRKVHFLTLCLDARKRRGRRRRLGGRVALATGHAWLWACPEAFQSVDVLFIDEAAQMSLANVLAVSEAAENVVLLRDPRQL
jgi:hypothetical protein